MFDSLRSIFKRERSRSNCENTIRVTMNGQELVSLVRESALAVHGEQHMFCRKYLLPFMSPLKDFFKHQMDLRISCINEKRHSSAYLSSLLEEQTTDREGFIWMILQLWYPYMQAEIVNSGDAIKFLRVEVHLLLELIISVLKVVYLKKQRNKPEQQASFITRKFKLFLLGMVTDSYQFKKINKLFIKNCKEGRGANGIFTPSQVALTALQFNQLMRFTEIPAPFHESIGLMLDFYQEYQIQKKVKKLVKAYEKTKEQITQYRNFFNMGNTVIGSDQIMPIMNFICEKTGKNIFGSIQYIRALMGGGRKSFNQEQCIHNLKMIESNADYCVDLVQSMSSVYCHASQIL